jgi:hypothetical protein
MSLEKQLLFLICAAFVVVCFGAFMFVPELMEAQRARPVGHSDGKSVAIVPRPVCSCLNGYTMHVEHLGVQTEDRALNGAINQAPLQQDRSHFDQPPDAGAEQAARLERVRTFGSTFY